MSICFCGVCIPYTAIWPVLLLVIQPVWAWISKLLGLENKASKKTGLEKTVNENPATEMANNCDCCVSKNSEFLVPPSPFELDSNLKFDHIISNQENIPVIARFTADWCKPCKAIEPEFNALAKSNRGKAHFVAIDVDVHDALAEQYEVYGIPHFIVFDNSGKKVAELKGSDSGRLNKFVQENVK